MSMERSRGTDRTVARDWPAEQRKFLDAIAPESHFHRAFDGLGDTLFFAKNLAGETLFFSRGSRLAPAVRLLQTDLVRFPPVASLARACGMSPRQLQRSFQEIFSFSPRTYWMKCRIRTACEALRADGEPILSVSQRLGFCDQSNFTQHFRRHTGLTPAGYRRSRMRRHPRGMDDGKSRPLNSSRRAARRRTGR